jgi:hypothetical protein
MAVVQQGGGQSPYNLKAVGSWVRIMWRLSAPMAVQRGGCQLIVRIASRLIKCSTTLS